MGVSIMHPIIRNALISGGSGGGGAPAFIPIDLFQASEQGVWHDPSDLSTMFQGSAGITQVTATGQSLGLMLDKSKGLLLGSELSVNGDFSAGTTGWTGAGVTQSIVSGALRSVNTSSYGYCRVASPITTVANKWYEVNFNFVTISSVVTFRVGSYMDAEDAATKLFTSAAGLKKYYFQAVSTTTYFSFQLGAGIGEAFDLDDFSVKQIAGNHAKQPTTASRPILALTGISKFVDYDAVDDALVTTFQSSLGSACTVARAVVGGAPVILTGQTIGTTFSDSTDNAGLVIVDRALTGQETTDLTAWLTAKGATS